MFAKVLSGSLHGLDAETVAVEIDLSNGLPGFQVVGLPDTSVRESKERIRAALKNCGYQFPAKRITINLSPANTKKEGTHFDLPIAIGILIASGVLPQEMTMERFAFFGELSLDGKIKSIKGALPLVLGLRKKGIHNIILPMDNAKEASVIEGISLFPIRSLSEIVEAFGSGSMLKQYRHQSKAEKTMYPTTDDFIDVCGQESVKRALQIAAAASHNVLMVGPPGSGKTMMARRLPGIMPDLTYEEQLEVTQIFSIAGELSEKMPIIDKRQFRIPHHTISVAALVGGGHSPKPGEISLAHYGVLFFDELPEFKKNVLEALRQPMEEECVTISRSGNVITYPSKFLFAASMNPCPCGYFGDPVKECRCSLSQIHQYMGKISGPLMDRIDMHIEIFPVQYNDLYGTRAGKSSQDMKYEVEQARKIQKERYKNEIISYNSQLTPSLLKKYCKIDKETDTLLKEAFNRLALSARAYSRILRLSRTIADMDMEKDIRLHHVAEAINYRSLDKKYKVT